VSEVETVGWLRVDRALEDDASRRSVLEGGLGPGRSQLRAPALLPLQFS